MSILKDIFNEEYCPSKPLDKLPFSLRLKERAFFDAIEEAMGAGFIEKHWDALVSVEEYKNFANFREGFRLGVSLMLELR